jgi:ketosteroid isomerase-like protein
MKKKDIINQYFQSWLTKDFNLFNSTLDENVRIEECYGAYYIGKIECQKWFEHWNKPTENKVLSWVIKEYWEVGDTTFATWTFACAYQGKQSLFDGISLFKFENEKIVALKEFEMKAEKFRPYE